MAGSTVDMMDVLKVESMVGPKAASMAAHLAVPTVVRWVERSDKRSVALSENQ